VGKYLESNLSKDERIMENAEVHDMAMVGYIVWGVLLIWTVIFPIWAIVKIIALKHLELGFTNKRIMGKTGIIRTDRLDAPLNKVDSVNINQGLGGKIFGYGTVVVSSTSSKFLFNHIKAPEIFRSKLMQQIETFDEDRIKKQAEMMAQSMKG
jgi:uncharacterized membrane protein YdbT with pleckstrin-like domain